MKNGPHWLLLWGSLHQVPLGNLLFTEPSSESSKFRATGLHNCDLCCLLPHKKYNWMLNGNCVIFMECFPGWDMVKYNENVRATGDINSSLISEWENLQHLWFFASCVHQQKKLYLRQFVKNLIFISKFNPI